MRNERCYPPYLVATLLALAACQTSGEILSSVGGAAGADPTDGVTTAPNGGAPNGGTDSSASGGNAGESGLDLPFQGAPSSLSLGSRHSCFISLGALYCFGAGQDGALGNGSSDDHSVAYLANQHTDYLQVGAGSTLSCALRASGELECSGLGQNGATGSFSDRFTLEAVPLNEAIQTFDVGSEHVCAIERSGRLYCWGANAEGQLGQADPFPDEGPASSTPLEVPHELEFQRVAAGQGHTCAIDVSGALYCWGRNSSNELGLGPSAAGQLRTPQRVGLEQDWQDVRAGQSHACATRSDASLWCWGGNSSGQLGTGDRIGRDAPTQVATGVLGFDLDTFHTCIQTVEGIACVGRGIEGALGTGDLEDRLVLTSVPGTEGALEVGVGRFHSCFRTTESVYCTGQNDEGRLGLGDLERRATFSVVLEPRL